MHLRFNINSLDLHKEVATMTVWFRSTFGLLLVIKSVVLAQSQIGFNYTTIDPSQCVSPSQYLTCYNNAVAKTANCMALTNNNPTAQQGCACIDGEDKINCFAEACWNRVGIRLG